MQPSYLASEGRPNLFTRVLLSIMLIVLAIFPFGMGVIRIAQGYVGKMTMISLSVMALIVGLILSLCAVTMLMAGKKMSKSQVWFVSLGLFVLSMVIRVLSSYLLQTQPISDFNICYQFALGNPPEGEALGIFPYLGAYALVLKSLFNILPKAVLTAQVFNAAVLSLVPVFLFLGIRKCMGNDRPAITETS